MPLAHYRPRGRISGVFVSKLVLEFYVGCFRAARFRGNRFFDNQHIVPVRDKRDSLHCGRCVLHFALGVGFRRVQSLPPRYRLAKRRPVNGNFALKVPHCGKRRKRKIRAPPGPDDLRKIIDVLALRLSAEVIDARANRAVPDYRGRISVSRRGAFAFGCNAMGLACAKSRLRRKNQCNQYFFHNNLSLIIKPYLLKIWQKNVLSARVKLRIYRSLCAANFFT